METKLKTPSAAPRSLPMWGPLFARHKDETTSLQAKIRQMMVGAILDGQMPVGEAMPSSRDLAEALGVARNTVVLAYQQLVTEGFLLSRERSGFFVNPDILQGRAATAARDALSAAPVTAQAGRFPDWDARFRQTPMQQRNIEKPADWQRFPYPFLYGQFDASLFPTAEWRECCIKALSVLDIREWAPDLILRDDESLVQQICTRVLPRRGVWASADEVVVTVGAQNALYMVADLLLRPDTRLAIENPCYPDARNIFSARTPHLTPIDVDDGGMPVDDRLRDCDYVYVTPSHQCPTTVTMPLDRREALLRQAEKHNFVVIEDDYEMENNFSGEPIPALKSLDTSQRVIYVGSLSKSFAPGLRMGYVVAPPPVVAQLRGLRRLMIRHPSAYIQRAFSLFLSLGHYDTVMRRVAHAYHERAKVLEAALARHTPELTANRIIGGASCWVRGPQGLDAQTLARAAQAQGILIEPGSIFFAEPAPENFFRLGFSAIDAGRIEEGIQKLGRVLRP